MNILGSNRHTGKENGNYYGIVGYIYWDYTGILEKKMQAIIMGLFNLSQSLKPCHLRDRGGRIAGGTGSMRSVWQRPTHGQTYDQRAFAKAPHLLHSYGITSFRQDDSSTSIAQPSLHPKS